MPGNFHSVPASVIATWPTPQYDHPSIERTWMPGFGGVLIGISTLLVAGRIYLRTTGQAGTFGLDDGLIVIGWLFAVGTTTLAIIEAEQYGLSRHTWDVRLQWYPKAALCAWIAQVFFTISTCATKASVLLFYRRMVKDTGRWIYAIWAALAFTACYFLGIVLAYCLICQPLEAYWLSYDFSYNKPYKCINPSDGNVLSLFVGILSVVSDLYSVILPILVVRDIGLDIPRRQRIGLNIIFALGLLVAGAGIARTYYLWRLNHTYDTSWTGFNLYIPSLLECHLAIIGACAPSLRVFLRRYFGDALNRTFGSYGYARSRDETNRSQSNAFERSSGLPIKQADKRQSNVDERSLADTVETAEGTKKNNEEAFVYNSTPRIKNSEEYEAYAMQQLKKHAYKRSNTGDSIAYSHPPDPRRQHDVENARSWLA